MIIKNSILSKIFACAFAFHLTNATDQLDDTGKSDQRLEVIFKNGLTGTELATDEITNSRQIGKIKEMFRTKFPDIGRIKLSELVRTAEEQVIPNSILCEMRKISRQHSRSYVVPKKSEEKIVFDLLLETVPHKILYIVECPDLNTFISEFGMPQNKFFEYNPGIEVFLDRHMCIFGVELSNSSLKIEIFIEPNTTGYNYNLFEELREVDFSVEMMNRSLRNIGELGSKIINIFFKIEDDLDARIRQVAIDPEFCNLDGGSIQYYLDKIDRIMNGQEEYLYRLLFESQDKHGLRNRMRLAIVDHLDPFSFSPNITTKYRPVHRSNTFSIYLAPEAMQELDALPNGQVMDPIRFMPHMAPVEVHDGISSFGKIYFDLHKVSRDLFQIHFSSVPERFEFKYHSNSLGKADLMFKTPDFDGLTITLIYNTEKDEAFSPKGLLGSFINTLDPENIDPTEILRYICSTEELRTTLNRVSTWVKGRYNFEPLGTDKHIFSHASGLRGPFWENIEDMSKQLLVIGDTLQKLLRTTPVYTISVVNR